MLVRRLSGCESWERGHDNTMASREHNCTFKFVIGLYFMHRIRSSPRKSKIDLIDSSQENKMNEFSNSMVLTVGKVPRRAHASSAGP